MRKPALLACTLALVFLSNLLATAPAAGQAGDKGKDEKLPDLVAALKATPGCLGVETARTSSGKQVIFAWFEDKKAALKWYHSDTHRAVMKRFFPDAKRPARPLAGVPEDSGPILAIASITLKGKPTKEGPLPFSQIAIELYKPLGGGLSIGGRFAPEKMKLPAPRKAPEKK